MENFIVYNPTTIHFGKNVCDDLGKTIKKFGDKVLFIYGKGSIKTNGIYEKVIEQLNAVSVKIFEYNGIKSNPVIEDVDAAAELGRKNNIDVILAVGGGSVIDSAKIISIAIPNNNNAWDFFEQKVKPTQAIPLVNVLTLAATGTEMNPYAVIQNNRTKGKLGYENSLLYPKHSFLDPQNTFSVPKNYTAYGIVDLIAHALEEYFGKGEASLSDRFVYAIIKEAMYYGPLLLQELNNYKYRAKIMYSATCALNGLTDYGRVSGDWGVHEIGHVLSLLYDIPHGATLSIVYPAWLKLLKDRIPERITELGKALFNVDNVIDTIVEFEKFFKSIECPLKVSEYNINEYEKEKIFNVLTLNKASGYHHKLGEKDYLKIINNM